MAVAELLTTLSDIGRAQNASDERGGNDLCVSSATVEALLCEADVRKLQQVAQAGSGAELWTAAAGSPTDVGRDLTLVMRAGRGVQPYLAAAAFGALLATANCPVSRIFNAVSCEAFLRLIISTLVRGSSSKPMHGDDGDVGMPEATAEQGSDAAEGDIRLQLCTDALAGFAAVLGAHSLADEPDMLRSVAESLAEVACSVLAPQAATAACLAGLSALLQPCHGSVPVIASMVLRLVTPALLAVGKPEVGDAGGSCKVTSATPTKDAIAASTMARDFVAKMLRDCPAAHDAIAALARHLVMKAPDKADFRSLAADAAVSFIKELPAPAQTDNCVFLTRLSRTPKVAQRMMAVELAPRMLRAMPQAYSSPAAMPCTSPWGTPDATQMVCGRRLLSTGGSTGSKPASEPGGSGRSTSFSLPTPVTGSGGNTPQHVQQASPGATCLAVLLQRCSDKSAVVRAKALSNLATIVTDNLRSDGHSFRQALAAARLVQHDLVAGKTPGSALPLLISPAGSDEPGATPMHDSTSLRLGPLSRAQQLNSGGSSGQSTGGGHRLQPSRLARLAVTNAVALSQQDLDIEALVRTARRRAADEKAGVRKAGVALLEALLLLRAAPPPPLQCLPITADIAALKAAACDPLVSVRKAALTTVHKLLAEVPLNVGIAQLWLTVTLPMVQDAESSLQEITLAHVHEVLLAQAAAAAPKGKAAAASNAAAETARQLRVVLGCLSTAGATAQAFLSRACAALHAKKRLLSKTAAAGLQAIIEGSGRNSSSSSADVEESGAWLLLAEVAAQDSAAICWAFLKAQWEATQAEPGVEVVEYAGSKQSTVLRIVAATATHSGPEEAAYLTGDLLKALQSFSLPMEAVATHMRAVAQLTAVSQAGPAWQRTLLADAERLLSAFVSQAGGASASPGGDVGTAAAPEERAATALFTIGEAAVLCGSRAPGSLVVLVQALTAPQLMPPQGTANGDATAGTPVPGPLQAHAWTALGKLCLVDEKLAKACVPHFARQLREAALPAVRNNIAVGLTDMCIAYTGLVDAHVPRLAACLSDEHELVRCQALALLAHLLQKDFVKLRGPLFHRFLLALVDDSPRVRGLAEYLLGDTLAAKAPLLAYNNFVEALFSLNCCREVVPAAASQIVEDGGGYVGVSAEDAAHVMGASPAARAKRDVIYRAMLLRMSPEHKFATAARLSGEVLGGVADETLSLSGCGEVLADALRILASPDIKVSAPKGGAAAGDEPHDAAAAVGAAKGRVVSSMMRKHLVAAVVPVALQLKRQLEEARHVLLGDLMVALASLLADYKHEVEDILAADPQTAKELLYDIRQAEAARRAAATSPQGGPGAWRRAGSGTAPRPAHSTPGVIGLLDVPAAADALHGDGPGSATRLQLHSRGRLTPQGRLTPRAATPRSAMQAMQTPAARSSSGTPSGRVDSPVTSVPRLRGGSKQLAGATAAHADATAPNEPAAHVVVKQPTPPVPWRIGTEAASPLPAPGAAAQAAPQADAQPGKPRGRRGAARGKKRGRGS